MMYTTPHLKYHDIQFDIGIGLGLQVLYSTTNCNTWPFHTHSEDKFSLIFRRQQSLQWRLVSVMVSQITDIYLTTCIQPSSKQISNSALLYNILWWESTRDTAPRWASIH